MIYYVSIRDTKNLYTFKNEIKCKNLDSAERKCKFLEKLIVNNNRYITVILT